MTMMMMMMMMMLATLRCINVR